MKTHFRIKQNKQMIKVKKTKQVKCRKTIFEQKWGKHFWHRWKKNNEEGINELDILSNDCTQDAEHLEKCAQL